MINSDLYISLMKLNEICEVYSGYAIKEFNNILRVNNSCASCNEK